MGYKRKENHAAYMRKWRKFKKKQREEIEAAIRRGDIAGAQAVLNTQPSIDLGLPKQPQPKKRSGEGKKK